MNTGKALQLLTEQIDIKSLTVSKSKRKNAHNILKAEELYNEDGIVRLKKIYWTFIILSVLICVAFLIILFIQYRHSLDLLSSNVNDISVEWVHRNASSLLEAYSGFSIIAISSIITAIRIQKQINKTERRVRKKIKKRPLTPAKRQASTQAYTRLRSAQAA